MAEREKKTLIHKVYNTIKKYHLIETGDILVLGVSGGPDSITMLDILLKIKQRKVYLIYRRVKCLFQKQRSMIKNF